MLLLAMDANFRLKNCLRANEHQDPLLGPGMGYFVEDTAYRKHLKNYVAEVDVSGVDAISSYIVTKTEAGQQLYRLRRPTPKGDMPDDRASMFWGGRVCLRAPRGGKAARTR
jgi:hypothetical protein